MSRFFVKELKISGSTHNVTISKIEFTKGVNIIHGPSNTGKSYVINCLNYMFGSDTLPFSKAETKYDTITITFESDNGESILCKRSIADGKGNNDETVSNIVQVINSTIPQFPEGDYYVKSPKKKAKPYSELLLYLAGITHTPHIIVNQERKTNAMSLRSIFHFFFLDEDYIFKKDSIFYPPHHFGSRTMILTALLFLLNGKEFEEEVPSETKEEKERREIQRSGVVSYLRQKIKEYSEKRSEVEAAKAELGDIDIENRIKELLAELSEIEKAVIEATAESKSILEQIFAINPQLEEARLLKERYHILHTQYSADIKRLMFIADGESKSGRIKRATKCPFCNHTMAAQAQQQISYAAATSVELERVKLQLQDLEEAERDVDDEISLLEAQIKELNKQYEKISRLIEQELKPQASKLNMTVESYKRMMQLQQQITTYEYISKEFNDEIEAKALETEETVQPFDAKKRVPTDAWKILSDQFADMVKECRYPNSPVAQINFDTLDALVGGKEKKNEGKGYRAFLNTLMLFNLMKFLEINGKYALRMLFLDSPILSLKEKDIPDSERTTVGMRQSLFRYLMNNCGENQLIIIENTLPPNIDYSKAQLIEFTQDDKNGRYGFLMSVKNV